MSIHAILQGPVSLQPGCRCSVCQLTFKNASIAEEIRHIPLERIVLETDSPCLSPTPLRGTRNENSRLPLIAAKIAAQKGVTIEEVASVTTASARRLFGI